MSQYATATQFRATYPDAAASDDAALGAILTRASGIVDGITGAAFVVAGAASVRAFFGSGTPYLALDPFADATIAPSAVVMGDGYDKPAFVTSPPYLVTLDSAGLRSNRVVWPPNVPVTVTAAYGYAAPPDDVVEAVLEIALAIWRETYAQMKPGDWRGSVGVDFQIPPRAKEILNRARAQAHIRTAFP